MANAVASLSCASDYVEELLALKALEVAAVDNPNLLAVVQAPGAHYAEVISFDPTGNLLYFRFDPGAQGGFVPETVTTFSTSALPYAVLFAFYNEGVLNVVVLPLDTENVGQVPSTWLCRSATGTWAPPAMADSVPSLLKDIDVTSAGIGMLGGASSVLYGTATDGMPFVIFANYNVGPWQMASGTNALVSGGAPAFVMGQGRQNTTDQFTLYFVQQGASGSSPACIGASIVTTNGNPELVTSSTSVAGALPELSAAGAIASLVISPSASTGGSAVPGGSPLQTGDDVFLATEDNRVFLVSGFVSGQFACQEVTSVVKGQGCTALVDVQTCYCAEGSYAVFGIDPATGTWRVARCLARIPSQMTPFTTLDPIADAPSAYQFNLPCAAGVEAYFVVPTANSTTSQIYQLVAIGPDAAHAVWTTTALYVPKAPTDPVPPLFSYTARLVAADANAQPVAGATLSILSDIPAALIINGVASLARPFCPGTPAVTGIDGSVTIQVVPNDIMTAPVLTVSVLQSNALTNTFYLDTPVFDRLQNKDPLRPLSPSGLASVGLVPQGEQSSDVTSWIKMVGDLAAETQNLRSSATAAGTSNGASSPDAAVASPIRRWTLERSLTTRGFTCSFSDTPTLADADDENDTVLCEVADFLAWVGDGCEEVAKFVCEISKEVISFGIYIGNRLLKFVLPLIGRALQEGLKLAMRFVFGSDDEYNAMAAYLSAIFNWNDVVNTARVISYTLQVAFNKAPAAIGNAQTWVTTEIGDLKAQFAEFQDYLNSKAGMQSVGGALGNGSDGMQVFDSGHGAALISPVNQVSMNWLWDRVANNATVAAQIEEANVNGDGTQLGTLLSSLGGMQATYDGSSLMQAIQNFVNQPSWDSADALVDAAFAAVVNALAPIINGFLDLAGSLASTVLDGVAAAIELAAQAVTTPLTDVTFLNDLFAWVAGGMELNFLNLASMLVAVPFTLGYKVTQGLAEPVAPFSQAYVDALPAQPLEWPPNPALPVAALANRADTVRAIDGEAEADTAVIAKHMWMAGIAQFVAGAADICHDLQYMASSGEQVWRVTTLFNWASFCTACGMLAPWEALNKLPSNWSPTDKVTIPAFIGTMVQGFGETCLMIGSLLNVPIEPFCPIIKGGTGTIAAILGAIAGITQCASDNQEQPEYSSLTGIATAAIPLTAVFRWGLLLGSKNLPWMATQFAVDMVGSYSSGWLFLTQSLELDKTAPAVEGDTPEPMDPATAG